MLAREGIVIFELDSRGQSWVDEFHVRLPIAIRGFMDSDLMQPGTPGEPGLPRSLQVHRYFAFVASAIGFFAGGGVAFLLSTKNPIVGGPAGSHTFLGNVVFFGLPILGWLGGFLV